HLFFKKGVEMAFNHSTIQPFYHLIKQPSNQATKQSSNQAIKQRYHVFITIFITFTKDRLKIPYFLLFPLSLTLLFPLSLIRATTFSNPLIP
ncbi:hypothetical protein, partial [Helicobacter pylori]|uniref:hypothetical protein n=1 Tax=Helicobacter pylori TaxID=210 RepID=UPI002ED149E2